MFYRTFLMMVILSGTIVIYHKSAYGQCKSADSIVAQNDNYLPIQNNSFDPCVTWLKWDVWFTRNEVEGRTVITFEIHGHSDVYESYDSAEIPPGDYHFGETKYIGSSNSERLYMGRSGDNEIRFINIKGKAAFFAIQGD